MQNYKSKLKIFENIKIAILDGKEKTSQKHQKVYQKGKSSDSPGSFGYQRTGKINSGIMSKIFK